MKRFLNCRRTFIAVIALCVLAFLGTRGVDVASTIGFIVAVIAGANAGEAVFKKPQK